MILVYCGVGVSVQNTLGVKLRILDPLIDKIESAGKKKNGQIAKRVDKFKVFA
jgi:hypothetical protein